MMQQEAMSSSIPITNLLIEAFTLLHGDTLEVLKAFDFQFDMVFADPPYFLSNDGLTIQNGKIASVNKGKWDKSLGFKEVHEFNLKWLELVRDKMKDDATIWISGSMHNIFSIGQALDRTRVQNLEHHYLGKDKSTS